MEFTSRDFEPSATCIAVALSGIVLNFPSTVTFKLSSTSKYKSDDQLPAGGDCNDNDKCVVMPKLLSQFSSVSLVH